ncbi:DNA topoisomerase IV subunit A [Pelomicrobium sp. G1]|uniref:DNA topoisomerase IV subunit A n=1 Tax=unclassified Pelomicrobium TaxID=2815318 RepID=UPI003F76861C
MGNQSELFEGGATVVGEKPKPKGSPPAGGSGSGRLPPYFAPLEGEPGDALPLGRYASTQYLQYAVATVKDRALPRLADGQKPVQGRILYAMWEAGLRSGAKRTKSAAVVGDVLGKYHPHGDASVYDALVRQAQDWTLRYPLIDGEGNFGSRDGDDPAAYRYTEARLTRFAEVLLAEVDLGTVDLVPNYDGTRTEPKVLPARLPVVLLNGASGIAVGMATEIPSHNLNEVARAAIALIRDPGLGVEELMQYVPGPDFPGGAQIITPPEELKQAYETGRGTIRVRARWTIERLARGQWQVVVQELPPGTSARKVLEEIEAITNPQPKPGKKSLAPEQVREKQLMLSMLDRARDESDRAHPVRLVFEPKTSRVDETEFVNLLLAKTSLETNVSLNLTMVGLDGRPATKSLKQALAEWLEFRLATVTRRTRHRLAQVLERIHVLQGRMLVLLHVDKVIKIIRAADDPKAELIKAFKLTERQAEDILEIRLRQLAKLEHLKVEKELEELRKERETLEKVLASRRALENLVVKEIEADARTYGDERRTLIEATEKAAVAAPVIDEPVTVIFSRNGWVRSRQGWEVDASTLSFKEGDSLAALIHCRTVDPVVFLDSNGRAYTVQASELPSARGDGAPASSLVEVQAGGRILHCVAGRPDTRVLVAGSGGYGFITTLGDMLSTRRAGREFMALEPGEAPIAPFVFEDSPGNYVAALSERGRLLLFSIAEMKRLARGRGVIVMGLETDEKLAAVAVSDQQELSVSGVAPRSGKSKTLVLAGEKLAHYCGHRARMGRGLPEKLRPPLGLSVPARPSA